MPERRCKCGNPLPGKSRYCPKCKREYNKLWRARHGGNWLSRTPRQRYIANAKAYLRVNLRRGKVTPQGCQHAGPDGKPCGLPAKPIQVDYTSPLAVVWRCPAHGDPKLKRQAARAISTWHLRQMLGRARKAMAAALESPAKPSRRLTKAQFHYQYLLGPSEADRRRYLAYSHRVLQRIRRYDRRRAALAKPAPSSQAPPPCDWAARLAEHCARLILGRR